MGWNHPEISLEDMMKLVKGFVDILILTSGFQSSGHLAHWDAHTISKAFQWGLFFENVFRSLSTSGDYQDSVKELDAALSEMTSDPLFPQGIVNLSSATLIRARDYVLEHLIQSLPLRDGHLRAFLTATIDMDLNELIETEHNYVDAYLSKLSLLNTSLNLVPDEKEFEKDSMIKSPDVSSTLNIEKCSGDHLTKLVVLEVLKRQSAVSCILSAETGLNILSNTIGCGTWIDSGNCFLKEQLDHENAPMNMEQFVEFSTWNNWKSRSLSYFLDKRTVRLVSGASMIFSSPEVQWIQVLERLNMSAKSGSDDFCETIELLLLGCIANKWSCLIEDFMSVSYVSLTTSKMYHEICNTLQGKSQSSHFREEAINLRVKGILGYLTGLLGSQLHHLWKLSPSLAAVAIPSWSPLFRLYVSEVGTQLKGDGSTIRCCSCIEERKEHRECELAERIWCLYIFHVYGSHRKQGATGT